MQVRSKKEQRLAAELGEIIDEMGQAMWNADKEYVASRNPCMGLTLKMEMVLYNFTDYCVKHYGK